MEKPEIVPEKLGSPLNYKILALIIGATIVFQVSIQFYEIDEVDPLVSVISFLNPLAASIACFVVAKRYKGTQVFGKAYFSLAIAYLMVFVAETTYSVYDSILGLDPYPSIADVFFFALYPFTLMHLIINIRFFNPSLNIFTKIWLVGLPASIILAFIFWSLEEIGEANFDFYYGVIFVVGSAITLTFAILGAKVFKEGILGKAWLLLVLGILAATIGDVWYYQLETFGGYDIMHPVNIFWYSSYWIIVYALFKHKAII